MSSSSGASSAGPCSGAAANARRSSWRSEVYFQASLRAAGRPSRRAASSTSRRESLPQKAWAIESSSALIRPPPRAPRDPSGSHSRALPVPGPVPGRRS
ncbi:hypothetical protein G6F24_016495 [Rhizopus arrhizus]|nr:hypothetical protein G6F24_016495 [Rhizopus arrhizus]